jgi:hypothetical protein
MYVPPGRRNGRMSENVPPRASEDVPPRYRYVVRSDGPTGNFLEYAAARSMLERTVQHLKNNTAADPIETRTVLDALWKYSDLGYVTTNKLLKQMENGETPNADVWQERVGLIDRAFSMVPVTTADFYVYRSIDMDGEPGEDFVRRLEVADRAAQTQCRRLARWSFVSTSMKKGRTAMFLEGADCCQLRIRVKAGTRAVPLFGDISANPREEEVLLHRSQTFKYVGATGEGSESWYDFETCQM